MNHEQITNGFKEAKENMEKSLQFFNDMMSDYGNKENIFYDKGLDKELDMIREDLSSIDQVIYCIAGALDGLDRININIDYEL